MAFYSKRHWDSFKEVVETIDTTAGRLARSKAGEIGLAERVAAYPVLTAENAQEAIDFQAARIAHHEKVLVNDPAIRAEAAAILKPRRRR